MKRHILLKGLKVLGWLLSIAVLAYTVFVASFALRYVVLSSSSGNFINHLVAAWLNQFLALAAIAQTLLVALLWRFRVFSYWTGLILLGVFGAIALTSTTFYLIYQT